MQCDAGKPYPEVTADFLPSSLGTSHSFVLVYSTSSPVLVCGTDPALLTLEDFLGRLLYPICPGRSQSILSLLGIAADGFAYRPSL